MTIESSITSPVQRTRASKVIRLRVYPKIFKKIILVTNKKIKIPNVDIVIASVGSGGSLLGLSMFLSQINENIKFIPIHADSGSKIPGVGAFIDGDYITPFIKKAEFLLSKEWFRDCLEKIKTKKDS